MAYEFIENPRLTGAKMLGQAVESAPVLLAQLQDLKQQRDLLDMKKKEQRFNAATTLFKEAPNPIKVQVFNKTIRPMWGEIMGQEVPELTIEDVEDKSFSQMLKMDDEINAMKGIDQAAKKQLRTRNLSKYLASVGDTRGAASALLKDMDAPPSRQHVVYMDDKGVRRHGAFDPATGQVIKGTNDAIAPSPGSYGANINPLSLNYKAKQMAQDMYVQKYPEKAEVDPITGRITQYKLTVDDMYGDEFLDLMQKAEGLLSNGAAGSMQQPPAPQAIPPAGGGVSLVERVTKDGKVALFDSKTKKFVRFK